MEVTLTTAEYIILRAAILATNLTRKDEYLRLIDSNPSRFVMPERPLAGMMVPDNEVFDIALRNAWSYNDGWGDPMLVKQFAGDQTREILHTLINVQRGFVGHCSLGW